MKTCTKCAARLPLRFFPLINGKVTAACAPCRNTESEGCATRLNPCGAIRCRST